MAKSVKAQKTPAQLQAEKVERAAKKVANFKRLATQRMSATLTKLNSIKQLANRNAYTFDQAQVDKILIALKRHVNEIETAFANPTAAAAKPTFEL